MFRTKLSVAPLNYGPKLIRLLGIWLTWKWTAQNRESGWSKVGKVNSPVESGRTGKKWTLSWYSGLVHQKLDGIKDCGPLKCDEIGWRDNVLVNFLRMPIKLSWFKKNRTCLKNADFSNFGTGSSIFGTFSFLTTASDKISTYAYIS